MEKNELINKIRGLDALTNEEKSSLIGLLRKQKKYGLVWEDKPEAVEERLREELPVLIEDASKAIVSTETDAPNHVLIEGDNLEALTALAYTHEGKIDVIYIDPPYNTGNKDFVYNDRYVDSEDSYRHSKWLSFMSRRLRIAKQLLSDKGVIFISIDDNEQATLKLLCDEVFPGGFLQLLIIESNPRGSQASKYFANVHEYLFCYSRRPNPDKIFGLPKTEENISEFSFEDKKGKYRLLGLRQRGGAWRRSDRPLLFYPLYVNPTTKQVSLFQSADFFIKVLPKRPTGEDSRWTWSKEKISKESHLLQGVIVNEGTPKEKWDIARKNYLLNEDGEERTAKVKSIWAEKEINYQNGGSEVKEIVGDGKFSYPKPLFLLRKILSCSTYLDSTILDFFAGSGTTLHAVMQLNADDGGHRKCILVTNNENNICEEVTYERNKRVINGYTKPNGEAVEGLHANNLRYYRTGFVGRERNMKNMRQLMALCTDMLCIKEDLYTELPKFGEQPTHKNVFRYFDDGKKRMMVIYREEAVAQLAELIRQTEFEGRMRIYVFSPGEDPWEGEFEEVQDKVELCALPQAIYNAYRRILPKKKDEFAAEETAPVGSEKGQSDSLFDFDEEEDEQ